MSLHMSAVLSAALRLRSCRRSEGRGDTPTLSSVSLRHWLCPCSRRQPRFHGRPGPAQVKLELPPGVKRTWVRTKDSHVVLFTAASSPVSSAPRMTRSNSIPAHEGSVEAYAESPLGSTLSLSERPRSIGMIRSGSFRDRDSDEGEDLHLLHLYKKLFS